MEGAFLKGLKSDIHTKVKLFNPRVLNDIMKIIQVIEEKSGILRVQPNKEEQYPNPMTQEDKGNRCDTKSDLWEVVGSIQWIASWTQCRALNQRTPSNHLSKTIRRGLRLNELELQERRSRGLCFTYDEWFHLGHICKKELQLILVHDDEDGATSEIE